MELTEAIHFIQTHGGGKYKVLFPEGETKEMRLFVSENGNVCEFAPRSSRRGYPVSPERWVGLSIDTPDYMHYFRRNVKRLIQYLAASGFWSSRLKSLQFLQQMPDHELLPFRTISYKDWTSFRDRHHLTLSLNAVYCLFDQHCIKTVRYGKHPGIKEQVKQAIAERRDCNLKWTVSYDNSIHLEFKEEENRAWYSEEYRGCANGYYYLMLDDKHVSFLEKD